MFLSASDAAEIRDRFGTPCYVYDERELEAAARRALAFPHAFGFTLRYAMKANPNPEILGLFRRLGLAIDASSEWEVARALAAGFPPNAIQLTSQAPPRDPAGLAARGVLVNACSLHQLEAFGRAVPGGSLSVRINPGLGSGSSNRTNTGGPAASFGIWHEYLGRVRETPGTGSTSVACTRTSAREATRPCGSAWRA
jgi:diaminopimelate decarboxylase